MSISIATGDEISVTESLLVNDIVHRSVDLKGRPSHRSKSGGWKSASFTIGIEVAERFIYYGISSNLVTYLTGTLGQSTAAAAANVNTWSGTASLLPIFGAFFADAFLGRYRIIIVSFLLYILGLGFLSLSATLFNSSDCQNDGNNTICSPPQLQTISFFFSLYLVALAQGGYKPCVQAFGADQFDEEDEKERKAKSSFFNWWYFFMCASISVGILGLNYIQDNMSWGLSFGVSCIIMCLSFIIFLLGTGTYRFSTSVDDVNPFLKIGRVLIKAARNWQVSPPAKSSEAKQRLALKEAQFKFLDKALLAPDDAREDDKACSATDVEDTKAILGLVPIWFTCLGYAIVYSQTSTLFTKQGVTMNRHITSTFQIPAASLLSCISLTIVVTVPIYDRILVPIARAITKNPSGISMLQRIGVGIFLSFLSMVIAALVERKRLNTAIEYGLVDLPKATIPLSVWWLAPQYVLFGVSDVFTMIGLLQFFYDQVSSELKSVGLGLCHSIIGIGGVLSGFLISVIEAASSRHGRDGWFSDNLNRARLDCFYWFLAGLSAFEFAAYVYFARMYTYRGRNAV